MSNNFSDRLERIHRRERETLPDGYDCCPVSARIAYTLSFRLNWRTSGSAWARLSLSFRKARRAERVTNVGIVFKVHDAVKRSAAGNISVCLLRRKINIIHETAPVSARGLQNYKKKKEK